MTISTPIGDPPINHGYVSTATPQTGVTAWAPTVSGSPLVGITVADTMAGFIGQVRLDGKIVWESCPKIDLYAARETALAHLRERLR